MNARPFSYRPELPDDAPAIDALHRDLFDPGRFVRGAYRLREGNPHDMRLSFVAEDGDRLIASVRLTPIAIGGRPALLLGPLAVAASYKGRGAGRALVRMALDAARRAGHKVVMLVGDETYYGPLGFSRLSPLRITLPGPAEPERVLVAGLSEGALAGLGGPATRPDRKTS